MSLFAAASFFAARVQPYATLYLAEEPTVYWREVRRATLAPTAPYRCFRKNTSPLTECSVTSGPPLPRLPCSS